jgi:hypothetical protein
MKTYEGVDVLTSALAGVECSVSRPSRFISGKRAPPYPLARRLSGPQSRSDRREEKILDPTRTRTPDISVVQPVANRYTDYAIPATGVISQSRHMKSV